MHRFSPAELPALAAIRGGRRHHSHSAAKNRTFKTVRPNQGTMTGRRGN